MEIVAIDIGGTHARFARARIAGRSVVHLAEPLTLKTGQHASFRTAWELYRREEGGVDPQAVSIAFAGPVGGEVLKLTNNPWTLQPAALAQQLGVERALVVNDFAAVAHAVAQMGPDQYRHLAGPDRPLPDAGAISIVGPGTGLGVALLLRRDGAAHIVATEGGHMDFAPLDSLEDRILEQLRVKYRRVSVERIAAGMGLANLYEALGRIEGRPVAAREDKALWAEALAGTDSLAAAAFDRYCLSLGAIAGDLALAHGASAVVIAGGLGQRIADRLPASGFHDRFLAKGRFERMMAAMPIKLIAHPQPGLFGAAAAFAAAFPADTAAPDRP
jgi:glucokinase